MQQRQLMQTRQRGEVVVPVTVTDARASPIECEFIWAWVPSRRPQNPTRRPLRPEPTEPTRSYP